MLSDLAIHPAENSRLGQLDFEQQGFGSVFSDHMFTMRYADGRWQNPEIRPYGPIPMEPGVATLHYGQAVFEGLKAFRGSDDQIRIFRPDMNAKRLKASCIRLCIPPLPDGIFEQAVEALVAFDQHWIPGKRGQSLYVRPLIFGIESHLDVRASREFMFIVITAPVRAYFNTSAQGVALKVQEKFTRAAPGGIGFAKTAGNYAASLYPGEQSRHDGYDQVLWLDGVEHRYVEEVGAMNIFFKIDDSVVTPPLRGTILPGVTRDSVLQILQQWGEPVQERLITIDEVMAAAKTARLQEAFGAGTAAVIAPVGRIGYRGQDVHLPTGGPDSLTQRLYREITGIQLGEVEDRFSWNQLVAPEPAALAGNAG